MTLFNGIWNQWDFRNSSALINLVDTSLSASPCRATMASSAALSFLFLDPIPSSTPSLSFRWPSSSPLLSSSSPATRITILWDIFGVVACIHTPNCWFSTFRVPLLVTHNWHSWSLCVSLLYLKLTHPSFPLAKAILRPWHRGLVMSTLALILKKLKLLLPPFLRHSHINSPHHRYNLHCNL